MPISLNMVKIVTCLKVSKFARKLASNCLEQAPKERPFFHLCTQVCTQLEMLLELGSLSDKTKIEPFDNKYSRWVCV